MPAADEEELHLYSVNGAGTHPIQVSMMLNGLAHTLELDTGAAVTIMSQGEYQQLFPGVPLTKSSTLLRTYSGEPLSLLGVMNVEVPYKQQRESLKLNIVSGKWPSLLGRDWLQHLKLDWGEIKALASHTEGSLDYLIEKYNTLFTEGLGTIKTFQARLQVDPEGPPKFFKPRTTPYAIQEAVEDELDRLEREEILEKVTHSEWATPVVVVPKADGSVRLCGDFKVTINPLLKVDQYPLPKAEDLFATLAGGQQFTKLDLLQAYLQLELHPDSMKFCTINTPPVSTSIPACHLVLPLRRHSSKG